MRDLFVVFVFGERGGQGVVLGDPTGVPALPEQLVIGALSMVPRLQGKRMVGTARGCCFERRGGREVAEGRSYGMLAFPPRVAQDR